MAGSTHQSPMLYVPMKKTDDIDWVAPLRRHIATVYQDSPDSYIDELSTINRLRQDMRGAGKDMTGRDLLYRYYGQLELLDLRFPVDENHVKVSFPWYDAFLQKLTSQYSIAYEKACTIFNMAACLSAIAALTPRSDAEGRKKAYHNFRASAGMFTYINDNFLHAPSLDLGRDTVKVLIDIQTAQAQEIFMESSIENKKSAAVIAKIAGQAAFQYSNLIEEIKDLVTKKILDKNWQYVIEVKAKYFLGYAQMWKAQADETAAIYGDALGRLSLAENTAKDAARLSYNTSGLTSNYAERAHLPTDTGVALTELTKTLVAMCGERKTKLVRDNEMIYHAKPTSETSLPALEKLFMGAALPINEVYGTAAVQQIIGADIFARLVPLSVHESASRYSEEKAQMVRGEAEKVDIADSEMSAALEYLDLPGGLDKYRRASSKDEKSQFTSPPKEVQIWADDVRECEDSRDSAVERAFELIASLRKRVRDRFLGISQALDEETAECESARARYGHHFSQGPSASLTRQWRSDVKDHLDTMDQAVRSDSHTVQLFEQHKTLIAALKGGAHSLALEKLFQTLSSNQNTQRSNGGASLLDLDDAPGTHAGVDKLQNDVMRIEDELGRLNKIKRERREVLKDLKEKIKADDISNLLILNKKASGIEPALFASELEKFRPHQNRLAQTVAHQQNVIQELTALVKDLAGSNIGRGISDQWHSTERQWRDLCSALRKAKDAYDEVREGTSQGLTFYRSLEDVVLQLHDTVASFVHNRAEERSKLINEALVRQSKSGSSNASSFDLSSMNAALPSHRATSQTSHWTDQRAVHPAYMSSGAQPPPPPPPPAAPVDRGLDRTYAPSGFSPISSSQSARQDSLPAPPPPPPPQLHWQASNPPAQYYHYASQAATSPHPQALPSTAGNAHYHGTNTYQQQAAPMGHSSPAHTYGASFQTSVQAQAQAQPGAPLYTQSPMPQRYSQAPAQPPKPPLPPHQGYY